MTDLKTIAAREQEIRYRLRDTRLAIRNDEDRLRKHREEEAAFVLELRLLAEDAAKLFAETMAIGEVLVTGDDLEEPTRIATEGGDPLEWPARLLVDPLIEPDAVGSPPIAYDAHEQERQDRDPASRSNGADVGFGAP